MLSLLHHGLLSVLIDRSNVNNLTHSSIGLHIYQKEVVSTTIVEPNKRFKMLVWSLQLVVIFSKCSFRSQYFQNITYGTKIYIYLHELK